MRRYIMFVIIVLLFTACNSSANEEIKRLESSVEVHNKMISELEDEVRNRESEIEKRNEENNLVKKDLDDALIDIGEKEKALEEVNQELEKAIKELVDKVSSEKNVDEENNDNDINAVNDTSSENKLDENIEESYMCNISESQFDSIIMSRFSALSRLTFDTFYSLSNVYKIHSNYSIENDWYVISDDSFEIELLDNYDALQVEFYMMKQESENISISLYIDTDGTDGWSYQTGNIGKFIEPHRESGTFQFISYYVIYTEITLANGEVVKSSLLPIYNNGGFD